MRSGLHPDQGGEGEGGCRDEPVRPLTNPVLPRQADRQSSQISSTSQVRPANSEPARSCQTSKVRPARYNNALVKANAYSKRKTAQIT